MAASANPLPPVVTVLHSIPPCDWGRGRIPGRLAGNPAGTPPKAAAQLSACRQWMRMCFNPSTIELATRTHTASMPHRRSPLAVRAESPAAMAMPATATAKMRARAIITPVESTERWEVTTKALAAPAHRATTTPAAETLDQ